MKRVFAFIGFTVAITLFVLLNIDFRAVPLITAAALVLLILSLVFKTTREGRCIPVVFASALFACSVFLITMYSSVMPQLELSGSSADAVAYITDIPEETSNGRYAYSIKTKSVELEGAPQNIRLILYSDTKLEADYYEYFDCDITFSNPYSSAFKSYGAYAKGEYLTCALENVKPTGVYNRNPLRYIILLRERIIAELLNTFDGDSGGLAVSLITGDKSFVSNGIYNNFKICGVTHSMAVSGLHVALAYLAVSVLLKPLYKHKKLQSLISGLFVFTYIGIADFSKSALRAGIMIMVFLVANAVKRPSDNLNSLGIATFIICLNPFAVTDAGALLTVSAMLGVLVIYPRLLSEFSVRNKILQFFVSGFLISLSVLLSTLPVGWLFFGALGLIGIFLNIIFIPLVQLAVISLIFFLFFSPLKYLAAPFVFISRLALKLMLLLTDFTADRFSFLYVDFSGRYTGIAIGFILLFIGITLLAFKKLNVKAVLAVSLVLLISAYAFSVCETRSAKHIAITENGSVLIYDNSVLYTLDGQKADRYFIEAVSENREVISLNSKTLDGTYENDFMSLYKQDKAVYLDIYNYRFEISDYCVTIGDIRFYRNLKKEPSVYIISIKEGYEMIIEEKEG